MWKEPDYDDANWPSGRALLYVETSDLPRPKNTPLTLGATTYYFRAHFSFQGDPDPWIEVFNGETTEVDLAGCYLTDQFTNLTRWAFSPNTRLGPGRYLLVWLDGEPGETSPDELHASFRLSPATWSLALVTITNGCTLVLD